MTAPTTTYDLLGIGIGPFDLGLAALAEPLADVDAVFLDQREAFSWHPGMLIEGTTLQVPFLADLVTMADPTSSYSFLAWLKATGRLYPFYVRESFYPLRAEYDQYCRWVAEQLPSLRWGRRVISVVRVPDPAATADGIGPDGIGPDDGALDGSYLFEVTAQTAYGVEKYCAKHLVLGTGTQPRLPEALSGLDGAGPVVHTSDYLSRRAELAASGSVTVVGSGQSAAEVYRDLLEGCGTGPGEHRVDWVTRSPRFFPMEYTKLTLEMTSPEYTDHYVSLPIEQRDVLGREQRNLYKGISGDLIDDIYDTLYRKSALGAQVPTTLLSDTEVVASRFDADGAGGAGEYVLTLRHAQLGTTAEHRTRAVVAATGYAASVPGFLAPGLVNLDARGRYDVTRNYTVDDDRRIHVVNGEEHTHGVTAPDLGFGAWRNSVILAGITGREPYPIERRTAFQQFGLPDAGLDEIRSDNTSDNKMEAAR
ncbi:lysine N(6)-hydroxylase/L-ornithine N(5)-oxygenase family protein [Promicromonospora sp. Populi]|uniref:lysine N(6)-hydroxylase/L-ornithine N(5)-oxygenase family protein n=1 Tax=Promicromonospora sp. Populi TaxID=3239420 RepID=UPI0034E2B201